MKIVTLVALLFSSASLLAQSNVAYQKDLNKQGSTLIDLEKTYGVKDGIQKDIPVSVVRKIGDIYNSVLGTDIPANMYIMTHVFFNEKGKVDHWVFDFDNSRFLIGVIGENDVSQLNTDSLSGVLKTKLPAQVANFISKRHVGKKSQFTIVTPLLSTNPKEIAKRDSIMNSYAESNRREGVTTEIKKHVIRGLVTALTASDTLVVKELYIEKEMLETVPNVVYRFPNLEILSLADNDIEIANIDFKKLPKLKHLKLNGNIIGNKGLKLSENHTLALLNLQSNVLTNIPAGAGKCKKLETLWLGRNTLTQLKNGSFRNLKQVKDINFYYAGISALPKGIKKLKSLQVLDLYYNNLEKLPKSITRLKNLTQLAVAHNRISALPDDIGKLTLVHTLFAHHNQLSKLPESIVKLQNLQIVDLGYNWFTEFPEALTKFSNLDELDISANNFTEFPKDLLGIKKLNKLHLRGNPFLTEDREVKYQQQFGHLKARNIEVFY
ncbi:MAG TPA: leucine-rich repeat domain-containing protein [Dyadobacter sp.]|jgi:Leucine-rich repeat (LRR) protein|nr:leucine-rich repeat domain-containing protein [Dyadobacter sp.]